MFDVDADGYLRLLHRGKADESGMVGTRILDGTRLTTNRISSLDAGGGTLVDSHTHRINNNRISFGSDLGLTTGQEALVLRVLMDMGYVEPTAIGDGDCQIAEL